ncbi:MAG TPA: isocitrate lyase/phosphoenolpyruvate mutase family protein [Cellulomonas sp.]
MPTSSFPAGPVDPAGTLDRARTLGRLHRAEPILRVVNVWDVASARTVAALPATRAIATSGHALADSLGLPDGTVPLPVLLDLVARIATAVDVPVTVDLDDGHDDPGDLVRRAVQAGAVGANIEDRSRPLAGSVRVVRAAVRAAEAEGVPFVLNARTDAIFRAPDRPLGVSTADAVERGRAYLAEGAAAVFVPGVLDRGTTRRLVDGLGVRRLSVIGLPGALPAAEYERLGVARISYGPHPHRMVLRRLAELADALYRDGTIDAPGAPGP